MKEQKVTLTDRLLYLRSPRRRGQRGHAKQGTTKASRVSRVSRAIQAELAEGEATEVIGSEEAFRRLLPRARALATPIVPFRADAALAFHNLSEGVSAVVTRAAEVQAELPPRPALVDQAGRRHLLRALPLTPCRPAEATFPAASFLDRTSSASP
ncbi:MAG: hypothetical protein EXR72_04300 [Myxococcales bacterium]|nr:hypothetical protein [Myxococcales bacterium]